MPKTVYVVMGPDYEAPAIAVFTEEIDAQRALDIYFGGYYAELVIDEHKDMVNASLHRYEVSGDMDNPQVWADFTLKELQPLQLVQQGTRGRWFLNGVIEAVEQQDARDKVTQVIKRIKDGKAPEIELIHAKTP